MQLFNKSAKLAIGSVMVIMTRPAGALTSAKEIASELEDSPSFVAKIVQELARQNILGSRKGIDGGFFMRRPPTEITLWDVVRPFESGLEDDHCMIDGGRICGVENGCGMHSYWARIRRDTLKTLRNTTVMDLHKKQKRKGRQPAD